MHYYSHNVGDYRKDTSHLSLLEHGVYRQLLDTYYLSEKPLVLDLAILMRTHSARNADEMRAFEHVLKDFFVQTEEGYIHKRCDVEIEAFHSKSVSARESAKARWDRVRAEKDADAMRTHSEGNANHKPLTINQEPEDQQPCDPPAESPERERIPFEKIRSIYNEVCVPVLSEALKLDDKRKRNIRKCWSMDISGAQPFKSGDFWRQYFSNCLLDSHWTGSNDRNWKADIEFLTRETSVLKVLERA